MTIQSQLDQVEMLPCPWCGNNPWSNVQEVTVSEGSTFRWRKVEGCCTDGPEIRHNTMADDQAAAEVESRAKAIAAWNERPAIHAAVGGEAVKVAWRTGWKLAPIEPTEAMLNQAITVKKHIAQAGPNQHVGKIWAAEIYEAMIGVVDCDCENEPLGLVSNECPEHNINPASPPATVDVGALRELVRKWHGITTNTDIEYGSRVFIEGYDKALNYCADELATLIGEKA